MAFKDEGAREKGRECIETLQYCTLTGSPRRRALRAVERMRDPDQSGWRNNQYLIKVSRRNNRGKVVVHAYPCPLWRDAVKNIKENLRLRRETLIKLVVFEGTRIIYEE